MGRVGGRVGAIGKEYLILVHEPFTPSLAKLLMILGTLPC